VPVPPREGSERTHLFMDCRLRRATEPRWCIRKTGIFVTEAHAEPKPFSITDGSVINNAPRFVNRPRAKRRRRLRRQIRRKRKSRRLRFSARSPAGFYHGLPYFFLPEGATAAAPAMRVLMSERPFRAVRPLAVASAYRPEANASDALSAFSTAPPKSL